MNVNIGRSDLDRCHRVGSIKPRLGPDYRHHRDIIVKFAHYNSRDQVFKVPKKTLKIPFILNQSSLIKT